MVIMDLHTQMPQTNTMPVKVTRLHPDAKLPTYATDGSGCFDLYAATVAGSCQIGSLVYEGHPVECGTGLAFEVPPGHVMLVFSRSGHGFNHAVRLANSVGVIDSDYRGEVKVKLTCDDCQDDEPPPKIYPGRRIAQAMVLPILRVEFEEVTELSATARGQGGFGSTGR
jgi:dUTP pyrophosphatase